MNLAIRKAQTDKDCPGTITNSKHYQPFRDRAIEEGPELAPVCRDEIDNKYPAAVIANRDKWTCDVMTDVINKAIEDKRCPGSVTDPAYNEYHAQCAINNEINADCDTAVRNRVKNHYNTSNAGNKRDNLYPRAKANNAIKDRIAEGKCPPNNTDPRYDQLKDSIELENPELTYKCIKTIDDKYSYWKNQYPNKTSNYWYEKSINGAINNLKVCPGKYEDPVYNGYRNVKGTTKLITTKCIDTIKSKYDYWKSNKPNGTNKYWTRKAVTGAITNTNDCNGDYYVSDKYMMYRSNPNNVGT